MPWTSNNYHMEMNTEFKRAWNSLMDEEHTEKHFLAVILEYVSALGKMLIYNNHYTYHIIQKELYNAAVAIRKIIHEELHM